MALCYHRVDKAPYPIYIRKLAVSVSDCQLVIIISQFWHESAKKGLYMAIIRWDPMSSMLRWPNIWDEDDFPVTPTSDNLDVYETKDDVVVKASVAGVDPDKVDVTFEKGVLTISAQEEEESKEGKKFYRKSSRSYSYRVAVPGNIDLSHEPEAKVTHGVVTVMFKKAEEAKPKKISIKK